MKILLLSGSFHARSRSLAILNAIKKYLGEHQFEIPRLDELPFYSNDLYEDKPEVVQRFLKSVKPADGILFCTPEYNHSIPAVLKNAIDWGSRPAFNSPLKGIPVSIITQAESPVGGAGAQAHLKLILDSTLSNIHKCHEMMITDVNRLFDHNMEILDIEVLKRLERHTNDFLQFVSR